MTDVVPVDLDAYFDRIGYAGARAPTLDTLRAIHALHPATIPFEAMDVLEGKVIDLSPAAIDAKLIARRRGGYCFEHNGLLRRVLVTLGFTVEGLAGRVRWMRPSGAPPMPRTHMVLRVTIDGVPWLADVGFGGCVPTSPLRLDRETPQPTAHETFRIRRDGEGVVVEAERDGGWLPLYDVAPDPQLAIDYEVANWFTSTHAESPFKTAVMAARVTPEARYALRNGRLSIRHAHGASEHRMLDVDGVFEALRDIFGLPVEPGWRAFIARMLEDQGGR